MLRPRIVGDARVYGHTTTAMHDVKYTLPHSLPPSFPPIPSLHLSLPSLPSQEAADAFFSGDVEVDELVAAAVPRAPVIDVRTLDVW